MGQYDQNNMPQKLQFCSFHSTALRHAESLHVHGETRLIGRIHKNEQLLTYQKVKQFLKIGLVLALAIAQKKYSSPSLLPNLL